MKTFYLNFYFHRLFLITLMLGIFMPLSGQVSLTSNGITVGIKDCNQRDLTTRASGGSGNYFYMYGAITPGASIKSVNSAHVIIDPQPIASTTYIVTVLDQGNNMAFIGQNTVTVSPAATGTLDDLFIPNAFSPNLDGKNDTWEIRNASKDPFSANKPIGAYKYKLKIFDSNGGNYVDLENEVGVNGFGDNLKDKGLISGMSYWNGFRQGTLNEAPVGTYYYLLTLYNCTYPNGREFKGWIYLAR